MQRITRKMSSTLGNLRFAALLLVALIPALLGAEMITHRVVTDDTLYNISKRYGVTIEDIMKINNLRDYTISLNQVLKIKEVDPYAAVTYTPAPESGFSEISKLPPDPANPLFSASIDTDGNWLNIRKIPANTIYGEDAAGNRYYAGIMQEKHEFGELKLQGRLSAEQRQAGKLTDTWLACQDGSGKWLWAKNLAPVVTDGEPQLALAVDASGTIYVAGAFMGEIELGAEKLISAGGSDIFAAKFDKLGNLLWNKHAGSLEDVCFPAIALHANGNICLAGEFSGTLNLDTLNLRAGGETDIFVAMLDSAGSCLWAERTNGARSEKLLKLEIAWDGGIIVFGSATGTMNLGSSSVGSKVDSAGNILFLARLSADGQWNWGSRIQQLLEEGRGKYFDTDANGNTWFSDNLYGSPVPNPIYVGAMSVNSSLSLLDSKGKKLWTRNMEGTDVSIDWISSGRDADVFIAGTFGGSLTLGSQKFESGEQKAQFYARFDRSGKCLWARKWLGTDLRFIETDPLGNLFLVAKYRPYVDSGGQPYYLDRNEGKLFVAQLDESGTWGWAAQTESNGSPLLLNVDFDSRGNLRIAGSCLGEIRFGAQKP